jgi:hypothetical protein
VIQAMPGRGAHNSGSALTAGRDGCRSASAAIGLKSECPGCHGEGPGPSYTKF